MTEQVPDKVLMVGTERIGGAAQPPAPVPEVSLLRRVCEACARFGYNNRLMVFQCGIRMIDMLLPIQIWYPAIWRISKLQAFIVRPLIGLPVLRNDFRRHALGGWLINTWLKLLTSVHAEVPIPIRVKGLETILAASRNPRGMVLCSGHLPLVDACLRPLVESACRPAVVAGYSSERSGTYPVWGLRDRLPIIRRGGLVLVKMRSILRKGGSVAILIDTASCCQTYSSNAFRLAQAVGAEVVFMVAELQEDGQILVEYFSPPDPCCRSEESMRQNLEVLQARIDHILQSSSCGTERQIAPMRRLGQKLKDTPVKKSARLS
jgi:hypothetical protein